MAKKPKSQSEKFIEFARKVEAHKGEKEFEEQLSRIVKHKPKPKGEKGK